MTMCAFRGTRKECEVFMIEVRALKLDDDLTIVSRLIYLTDKYIYPDWFREYDLALKVLPNVIKILLSRQ